MRKHNPATYRAVRVSLDLLFRKHGEGAATCINRYLRIRTETRKKKRLIAELESELSTLRKDASASRKKRG